MNERKIVDKQVSFERMKYLDFKERTGFNYKRLVKKHEEAVKGVDERQATRFLASPTMPTIMAIDVRLYAYLTEIALEYLALGAEISREVESLELRTREDQHEGEDL